MFLPKKINNSIFSEYKWLILVLLIFCSIFCSISLVNHYNFRTNGFDLGIYNNTIYDYSKFQINDNPVMHRRFDNILSDHLSLYHIVYAPFRYLLGTWTLLIFQILSFLFGAIGIYKLIYIISKQKLFALLGAIHFLSMWGLYSAISFDYHDNVVGAMFVPWLFIAFEQRNIRMIFIWSLIIAVAKENMSLWLAFIFAGFFILKFNDKELRKVTIIGMIASFAYFVLAVKFIMPALVNEGTIYGHLKYNVLGNTTSEMLNTIFMSPKYLFSLMFENVSGNPNFNFIKTELHFVVLLSGGIALFYKPQYFIMLIPIYLQKLLNNSCGKWGVNNHYSIEFAPILTVVLFVWIISMHKSYNFKKWVLIGATIMCFVVSMSLIDSRNAKWYDSKTLRFWSTQHYKRNFNVAELHKNLELIPENAKVCAQNLLVPHLAFREDIYTFPYVRDAEYIALVPGAKSPYPYKMEKYNSEIEKLKNDSIFIIVKETKDFLLLKRK